MNRKLWHISVAFMFVNMGWGMAWPYLPNYLKALGATFIMISMLSVLFNLSSTLGQYFWGSKSDVAGKRKPFVMFGIISSGAFFLVMGFVSNIIAFLALRGLQGFFVAAQTPAVSALISEISRDAGAGFGVFNTFTNIGFMAGNVIGGYITSILPINYVFIFSVIPFVIALLILLPFKEERRDKIDLRPMFRYDRPGRVLVKWENLRSFLKRNRNITIFSVSVFTLMLASGMVYSFLSILIKDRFGNEWVGYYFGMDSFVSTFLIYLFGKMADRYGSKPIVLIGLFGYFVTYILYYLATSLPLLFLAAAVSGMKWAAYFNSINTYVAKMSVPEERATALGLLNSFISFGWVVGPLLGAFVIMEMGITTNLLVALIPILVSMLIALFFTENDRYVKDGQRINAES